MGEHTDAVAIAQMEAFAQLAESLGKRLDAIEARLNANDARVAVDELAKGRERQRNEQPCLGGF